MGATLDGEYNREEEEREGGGKDGSVSSGVVRHDYFQSNVTCSF